MSSTVTEDCHSTGTAFIEFDDFQGILSKDHTHVQPISPVSILNFMEFFIQFRFKSL